ncbi:MAG: hypothetical protein ACOCXM_00685 [Myxococcota bacterium]
MRLLSITSLAALLAVVGAAGCSAIVDGDEYTGGGDGTNPHQRLVDLRTERVAEWCDCFAGGVWSPLFNDSADDCKARLGPSEDYAQCLVDVFDANPDEYEDTARCFVDAQETALECDERAACTPRGHQQCQAELATSELRCEGEAPESYLEAVYQCASDHMVGPPGDTCPEEDPFEVPLIIGANVGQGDDFNFSGSEDPMGDPCFWVLGGADDVVQWQSTGDQNGEVIIDTIGSNYDTTLHLIDGCETAEVLTCNDDVDFEDGIVQSRVRDEAVVGTPLTVVVDAVSPSALGAYRLNFTTLWCVDEGQEPPVEGPVGSEAFMGDLSVADNDMAPLGTDGDGACQDPSLSGPEEVVAWRAPAAGTYTFDTRGSDVDTVLYARQSCDSEQTEVCNDNVSNSDDSSELSVPLMRGETIILVVDTPTALDTSLENTAWQLNITQD